MYTCGKRALVVKVLVHKDGQEVDDVDVLPVLERLAKLFPPDLVSRLQNRTGRWVSSSIWGGTLEESSSSTKESVERLQE